MKFDKNKVLTVVTADQAKVGQKGWFADELGILRERVEKESPNVLEHVDLSEDARYIFGTNKFRWGLFYPASEPSYEERQDRWIKQNGVKAGTRVRFIKNFNADIDGSHCCEHLDAMGKTGVITGSNLTSSVEVLVDGDKYSSWSVPYTALEVIEEVYRQFNTGEEFKPFKDKWVLYNQATRRILSYNNIGVIIAQANWDDSGVRFITFETAFKEFQFEDGTPFGVKES